MQSISDRQLAYFTDIWANNETFANGKGNNRILQPENGRTLVLSSKPVDRLEIGRLINSMLSFIVTVLCLFGFGYLI